MTSSTATTSTGEPIVLLVDDEPGVRAVLARVLRAHGCQVLEASSGLVALAMPDVMRGAIDIVVTDLTMPEMGGREFARLLRARYPALGVLFLSGNDDDEMRATLPSDDACVFLAKPFEATEVVRLVRALCDRGGTGTVRAA